MPLYRESCEGQVRCLIKNPSENQEEAQNLAMQLVITFLQNRQGIFLFLAYFFQLTINLFVTSKKRNHEFTNHEFKICTSKRPASLLKPLKWCIISYSLP